MKNRENIQYEIKKHINRYILFSNNGSLRWKVYIDRDDAHRVLKIPKSKNLFFTEEERLIKIPKIQYPGDLLIEEEG